MTAEPGKRRTDKAGPDEDVLFGLLADRVNDLVCLHDSGGAVRRVFGGGWGILGYTPEEALHMEPGSLLHPDEDRSLLETGLERAADGVETVSGRFRMLARNGGSILAETRFVPVPVTGDGDRVTDVLTITRLLDGEVVPPSPRAGTKRAPWISQVLDAIPVGVAVADARSSDMPVIYVNDALCRLTDYRPDEMLGRNIRFLQADDRDQEALDEIRRAVKERRSAEALLRNYRKDGSFFWNHFMLAPVRNEGGEVTHFIGIQNDVSEHRRLLDTVAANERRLRLMTSRVSGAVFHFRTEPDGAWRAPFISRGYQRLTGIPAEEVMANFGVALDAAHPDDRQALIDRIRRAELDVAPFRHELRVRPLGGGESRWCFIEAVPERDGDGGLSWYGQMVDITGQKRIQEQLEEARREAEQASRVKSQFLANMSHELRTPLNAIVGMAELLGDTELDTDQRRYLEVFRTASGNLLEVINNLLDLSKIEAGHMALERQPFDLEELLERQLDLLYPRFQQQGVGLVLRFDPAAPRYVEGDPARLRQVLTNLVGNAVKFTESGGVTVGVTVDGAGEIVFRIADTGIGIPAESRDAVFDAFMQADAGITRRYGGTGLGLTICRQLVKLMGGEIEVESEVGEGTTFRFTAGLIACASLMASERPPGERFPGLRLLVVDGFPDYRLAIEDFLTPEGVAAVDGAASVAEARERIEAAAAEGVPYDAVLVDGGLAANADGGCMEPKPGGGTAVIVLSCGDRRDSSGCGSDHGFPEVVKPIKRRELFAALARAVSPEDAAGDEGDAPPDGPPAAASAPPREIGDAPGAAGRSVLVAEDEPTNALLVRILLEQAGCRVEVVDSGQPAVERVLSNRYDLVLMDLQMPGVDGYQATREIRRAEAENGEGRTPVVALSAHALDEYRRRSFEAGCDDYLTKPLDRRALKEVLERIEAGEL